MYTESWVVNALSLFAIHYPYGMETAIGWRRRMIHALGYSHDEFKATSPGRLCRGEGTMD